MSSVKDISDKENVTLYRLSKSFKNNNENNSVINTFKINSIVSEDDTGKEDVFVNLSDLMTELFNLFGFSNVVMEDTGEHLLLHTKDVDIRMHISVRDTHLVFSDSSTGVTHIRLKFNKEYDFSRYCIAIDEFISKLYWKNQKKNEINNLIENLNNDLSDKKLKLGLVLRSKEGMKFYIKSPEKGTFLYFDVDNELNLGDIDYIDLPDYSVSDEDKKVYENLIKNMFLIKLKTVVS